MKDKEKTKIVLEALKSKLKSYPHIMFTELPSEEYGERRVDLMTVMCGAPKIAHLTAFEIKVSRGDWLSEKKKIYEKTNMFRNWTENFIYVCPKDLIKVDEIPSWAGLIYVNLENSSTRIIKESAFNHHCEQPSWGLVRMMMRHIGRKEANMWVDEDALAWLVVNGEKVLEKRPKYEMKKEDRNV